jgi:hypothetical protein
MVRVPAGRIEGGAGDQNLMECQSNDGGITVRAGVGKWSVPFEWEVGRVYRFRWRVLGDRIQCFVDDKLILDRKVPRGLARTGRIGLYSYGDRSQFDNVRVVTVTDLESGGGR